MDKDSSWNTFKDAVPLAPLKIIAMENCYDFASKVDRYIVNDRQEASNNLRDDVEIGQRHYNETSFLIKAECPRFGSGEGKGMIRTSVRGDDVFIITDVINHSLYYTMYGQKHFMSPDDHYQDLKRIISAALPTARRINVIMPFLYESRQHKRTDRESLDCAMALEELAGMGVANIITFDAHDPRVQNAIPLHDFDNYSPILQFMETIINNDKGFTIDKNSLMIISPDEGAMGRAVYLANNLGVDMGMFYKRRDYTRVVNGKNPIVAHEFLGSDVNGKTVIIIDDMIASGDSMLDTSRALKARGAKKVIVCCTFGLFTSGFDAFDKSFANGDFDYIITTNLNYRDPEIYTKPWYYETDMSSYVAAIINTMNHDVSTANVLSPTERVQDLINRFKDDM